MTHYELLTIGYGRDTKQGFQDRCNAFLNPESVIFVDVRKEKSGSRNGPWAQWGWDGIGATLKEIGISYSVSPALANKYGHTGLGMAQYEGALEPGGELRQQFLHLKHEVATDTVKYCLLCAERRPYIRGRLVDKPNCHRVILADRLCLELHLRTGADILWTVTHIE